MDVNAVRPWETGTDLGGYRLVPDAPRAAVLVVHGFGEYAMRHEATMRAWAARGFARYAYDHRGHGHSPGRRATVRSFEALVDDAIAVRTRMLAEQPALPAFPFGVSMGGVVALRSAQRAAAGLRGVVLLAPGLAVAEGIPPFVQAVLRGLSRVAPHLPAPPPLDVAKPSSDPAVGRAYAADPLVHHGSVPLCTAVELVAAGGLAIDEAPRCAVPTLVLQGDADTIVAPVGADRLAKASAAQPDFTLRAVPGGYHELFNDPGGRELATEAADWMLARV